MISVRKILILIFIFLFFKEGLYAKVTLSALFSNHMVVQRNQPVKVRGTADPGEKIEVRFHSLKLSAKSDRKGEWQVQFPPFEYGGPFEMVISGKNKITFTDILIGDVWVCSGQSNMEFAMYGIKNSEQEIALASYPEMRLFKVASGLNEKPQSFLENGSWKICSPEVARSFSGVGYFFGRRLQKDLNIPIGLIESAKSGSLIESWSSEPSLTKFSRFQKPLEELKAKNYKDIFDQVNRQREAWSDSLNLFEPGTIGKWYLPETDCIDWQTISVPQSSGGIIGAGVGWFRKEFELQEKEVTQSALIFLNLINERSETYLNGVKIGESSAFNLSKVYAACNQLLKQGKNVLAIKVYNSYGYLGLNGNPGELYCQTALRKIPLSGDWKFKPGNISTRPFSFFLLQNDYPSILFNAMISPLINYPVKGVIWYQGEGNATKPKEYEILLPNLIEDWRKQWNIGDFPFLIVQLPNYFQPKNEPGQSDWAEFREAQTSALRLPNTGMAVTIDLGEADNIHPSNKLDVGERLALVAQKLDNNQEIISSGPVFHSMEIKADTVILNFSVTGKGLFTNDMYGYVKGFAIAGNNQKFYWAKALIKDNLVYLNSDKVKMPVAARYAWADNPLDANLRNMEGIPTAPFRTDNWIDKKE